MNSVLWMIIELAVNLYESYLGVHFIMDSFDNRCKVLNTKSLHIIGAAGMMILVTFMNSITVYEGISGISYALFYFLFTLIFLQGSMLKKIFVPILMLICMVGVSAISGNIISAVSKKDLMYLYSEPGFERFILLAFSVVLLTYIFAIVSRFFKNEKESLRLSEWLLILLVLGLSFLIIVAVHITIINTEITNEYINLLALSEIGIILINIICLNITVSLNKTNKREEQLIADKRRSEYSQTYAQNVKEQYEQIKRLRHDMKQYAATMQLLIKDGKIEEAQSLAEKHTEELSKIEAFVNVKNDFLNAILNSKLSFAKSKGIEVLCYVEDNIAGVEDIDLCNLIGNLLDNAISAAERCDIEQRLIEIRISSAGSRLVIAVRNSIEESVLEKNPNLKSTKSNFTEHGFGVKTIKAIAEKYKGIFDFYEEGLIFISHVELYKNENHQCI